MGGWTSTRCRAPAPPCGCWSRQASCRRATVSETAGFERDLARLVAACETGLDLPGVLAAAADAAGAALSAGSVSSYALSEQRDGLALLEGDGPQRLELPGLEPVTDDGGTLLPLVSAERVLGGLLAER